MNDLPQFVAKDQSVHAVSLTHATRGAEMTNRIWAAQEIQRTALGMSVKAASRLNVQAAADAGLDFVRFDLSKANVALQDLGDLVHFSLSLGLTPTVRVANPDQIPAVFAAGVIGVTVADVEGSSHAREIVERCRQAGSHLGNQLLVSVQIESVAALNDVETIAHVPGIHMLQSGRNDLAKSMGLAGQPDHPRVLEAEEDIAAAAQKAGKLFSFHFAPGPHSIDQARRWISRRIPSLTIGSDTQILADAARQRAASLRTVSWGDDDKGVRE